MPIRANFFASILASGRLRHPAPRLVRGACRPPQPPWAALGGLGMSSPRSSAAARPQRKNARRWAVPCHGAWQGTPASV